MKYNYKLPDLGEGITESEIVSWSVKEGQEVKQDDALFEVQNDKTTIEVPSPVAGKIESILVQGGSIASVGDVLVAIDVDEVWAAKSGFELESTETVAVETAVEVEEVKPLVEVAKKSRAKAIPSVRRYAREKSVDLDAVTASGKNNTITVEDIDAYLGGSVETVERHEVQVVLDSGGYRREAMSPMRRATMQAMVRSAQTIPSVTVFAKMNATELMVHRESYKDYAREKGINLTYTAYFVKAAASMLKKFPIFNAFIDEKTMEIVYRNDINIGVATNTAAGLYVPNIKNADRKNLLEISEEIQANAVAASEGKLDMASMREGSFTITNVGGVSKDAVYSTPIINFPEVGILGTSRIEYDSFVNAEMEVEIAPMMKLSFAFDHRIIDGVEAQKALDELRSLLKDPNKIVLEG